MPSRAPQATAPVSLVLADDDPIVREAVAHVLRADGTCRVIGEAGDGSEALAVVRRLEPQLLLLDMLMPKLPGIETLRQLETAGVRHPTRTIVLCSTVNDRVIVQTLQLGARGVLSKDRLQELPKAIAAVLRGHYWIKGQEVTNVVQILRELSPAGASSSPKLFGLTDRELGVVRLVAQGLTNREIAGTLSIAEDTVKRHLTNIFDKVGMSTRLELALFAIDHGLAVRPT